MLTPAVDNYRAVEGCCGQSRGIPVYVPLVFSCLLSFRKENNRKSTGFPHLLEFIEELYNFCWNLLKSLGICCGLPVDKCPTKRKTKGVQKKDKKKDKQQTNGTNKGRQQEQPKVYKCQYKCHHKCHYKQFSKEPYWSTNGVQTDYKHPYNGAFNANHQC